MEKKFDQIYNKLYHLNFNLHIKIQAISFHISLSINRIKLAIKHTFFSYKI